MGKAHGPSAGRGLWNADSRGRRAACTAVTPVARHLPGRSKRRQAAYVQTPIATIYFPKPTDGAGKAGQGRAKRNPPGGPAGWVCRAGRGRRRGLAAPEGTRLAPRAAAPQYGVRLRAHRRAAHRAARLAGIPQSVYARGTVCAACAVFAAGSGPAGPRQSAHALARKAAYGHCFMTVRVRLAVGGLHSVFGVHNPQHWRRLPRRRRNPAHYSIPRRSCQRKTRGAM